MTPVDTTTPVPKVPRRDHPPAVPGGRRQSLLFAAVVIVATVSPLVLGLKIGGIVPRLPSLDWTLAIDSRTAAAAAAVHGPKIVFIGGSNMRFGLDTAGLTRDLNMPVINYGLHASLGMDVIVDRALQCVNPGDVVVFAPELSHFRKEGAADFSDDLRIDFLAEHPSPVDPRLQSFPTREWRRARSRCNRIHSNIDKVPATRFAKLIGVEPGTTGPDGKPARSAYTVDAVGDDGSIVCPRPGPKPYERWTVSDPPANVDAMDLVDSRGGVGLSMLFKTCRERQCMFCVMPPLRLAVPNFDAAELIRMERHFLDYAVAHGATVVMNPGDTVLPREDGFDTDYHLNDVGVKVMEPRLAAAMRVVLAKRAAGLVNAPAP